MREPELSPRAERFQKFGNNTRITTKGGSGGFPFLWLRFPQLLTKRLKELALGASTEERQDGLGA